jgi:hypothetical protein
MNGTRAFLGLGDHVQQHGAAGDAAILDGDIDAGQILGDDPAGADIHMSHFGIAHLTLGQPHGIAGGFEQRMRAFGQEAGVVGGARLGDGVVGRGIGTEPPTIQNAQKSRARTGHYKFLKIGLDRK